MEMHITTGKTGIQNKEGGRGGGKKKKRKVHKAETEEKQKDNLKIKNEWKNGQDGQKI